MQQYVNVFYVYSKSDMMKEGRKEGRKQASKQGIKE